jgi:hypothetical protein
MDFLCVCVPWCCGHSPCKAAATSTQGNGCNGLFQLVHPLYSQRWLTNGKQIAMMAIAQHCSLIAIKGMEDSQKLIWCNAGKQAFFSSI